MAIKTVSTQDTFSKFVELTNETIEYVGDSAELTTTATTLSTAIKELDSDLYGAGGGIAAATLNTDQKNIVGAINEIEAVFDASASEISVSGNFSITTSSNALVVEGDVIPNADGTKDLGAVGAEWQDLYVDGTANIDTLQVDENATVTGTLTVNGASTTINSTTITLGNENTDNVVFGADVNSNIVPNSNSTYSLGSASQQWSVLYADSAQFNKLVIDNVTIDGSSVAGSAGITITASTGDIELNANGADVILKDDTVTYGSLTNNSGNLQIKSGTTVAVSFTGANTTLGGTLTVPTTLTVNGNTVLGDGGDTISLGATFSNSLIPTTNNAVDLGSDANEWRDLWIDGTAHIDTLAVDGAATVTTNLTVNGNTTLGNGSTDTLTVSGAINLPASGTGSVNTTANTVHGAINEIDALVSNLVFDASGPVDNNNATTITEAFNILDSALGNYLDPSSFDASVPNKSSFLDAINSISSGLSDLTAAVAEDSATLQDYISGTIGSLSNLDAPLSASTIIDAINDVNDVNSNSNHVNNNILRYNGTRMVPTGSTFTVDASGNTAVAGTLGVTGATTLTDNLTVNGATTNINSATINVGNATSDNVAINAQITTSLVPDANNTYDLGTDTLRWSELYLEGNADIDGTVNVEGNTTLQANLIVNGTVALGNATSDTISVNGYVGTNIIPNANARDLGTTSNRWDAYLQNIVSYGTTTLGDDSSDAVTLNGETTAVNGFIAKEKNVTKLSTESYGVRVHGTRNNTTLQFNNTTNDTSWSDGADFAKIEVYSADLSGDGVGLRGSIAFESIDTTGGASSFAVDLETGNTDGVLNRVFEIEPNGNTTVAGSLTVGSFDGSQIDNNTIALGTKTTGNYVGTITAGNGLASTGATTGEGIAHTLSVDLSELTDMTADVVGTQDELVLLDNGEDRRKLISEIALGQFLTENQIVLGTDTTGAYVADVVAGSLIDVTETNNEGENNTVTVNVDLSELTDMTDTMVTSDEFVVLDAGSQKRKAASEIELGIFNTANQIALGTDTTGNYVDSATEGNYIIITGTPGEGWSPTIAVDATTTNTASKVVARDASGNFSAGTISAALSGNATTATTLQTARTINGTSFNGSANITTANWGTARNITIGDTTKSVNGSTTYSWSRTELGITKTNIDALGINAAQVDGYEGVSLYDYAAYNSTGGAISRLGRNQIYLTWNNSPTYTVNEAGFQVGDTITFVNMKDTNTITVDGSTIYLPDSFGGGTATNGDLTLSVAGRFTIFKYNTTAGQWMVLP